MTNVSNTTLNSRWLKPKYFEACMCAAARLYEVDMWYEKAIDCEQVLSRYYHKQGDISSVLQCQARIQGLYTHIEKWSNDGDHRPFGMYYRVGFWGKKFGNLHGKEFIYREPKFCQLSEIQRRLIDIYSAELGSPVGWFKDSRTVDPSTLKPDECKLQITSVEPFFGLEDANKVYSAPNSPNRGTHWGRNHQLTAFIYDTPFTKTGKAHADSVKDQWKRKTILSIAPASFPCARGRLAVLNKRRWDVSPIEGVIEDINLKVKDMKAQVFPKGGSPSTKTLTQRLSGGVNAQVNGGPFQVCDLFLKPEVRAQHPVVHTTALQHALCQFLLLCRDGLAINRHLLEVEAKAAGTGTEGGSFMFQDILEESFGDIVGSYANLLFPDGDFWDRQF